MMILRNESINVISAGYILVKAAGYLGNYAANNPSPRALPCFNYLILNQFLFTVSVYKLKKKINMYMCFRLILCSTNRAYFSEIRESY